MLAISQTSTTRDQTAPAAEHGDATTSRQFDMNWWEDWTDAV